MAASALFLLGTTLGALLACCLLAFIGYTIYVYYVHKKFEHIPGPPLDSFYLGHLPTLISLHKKQEYFGPTFTEWAETYGPIVKVYTLHMCMLIPTSPELIKEIMTKGKYPKQKWAYDKLHSVFGERFMGDGVVTNTNHAQWYKKRNVINPAFHKKTLSSMMDKFNSVGNIWISKLWNEADGATNISMFEYLNRAALASIVTVGFGMNIDAINQPDHPFTQALHKAMEAAAEMSFDPTVAWRPGKRDYREDCRSRMRYVRRYSANCIEKRHREMSEGQAVPNDILTSIIKTSNKVDGVTTRDLQDEFNTLFLAGQETTASSIAFLLNSVGNRPDIVNRMREEVDEVIGDKDEITWTDVQNLEYIHQVFKETLRMYPVAPATVREVVEDTVVDGIKLPAGAALITDIFTIHHKKEFYDDPWEFNPERWAPDAPRPKLYTYLPFSMGPRTCAGQHFATIEAKVLIAKFLQNFNFELDPTQDFGIKFNLTLKPKGGCKMIISKRYADY